MIVLLFALVTFVAAFAISRFYFHDPVADAVGWAAVALCIYSLLTVVIR